jgi:hypothetical protein
VSAKRLEACDYDGQKVQVSVLPGSAALNNRLEEVEQQGEELRVKVSAGGQVSHEDYDRWEKVQYRINANRPSTHERLCFQHFAQVRFCLVGLIKAQVKSDRKNSLGEHFPPNTPEDEYNEIRRGETGRTARVIQFSALRTGQRKEME